MIVNSSKWVTVGSMSVDNWSNNWIDSLGRLESSSMSKVNGSNFSTSSLASSNLSQGVGLSFSLAKMMESIGIDSTVVDYRSSSIGQSNRDSTDCFYSSLRSVGNHSNIMKTTICNGILDWKTFCHLFQSVGLSISRDKSNGQTYNESSHAYW